MLEELKKLAVSSPDRPETAEKDGFRLPIPSDPDRAQAGLKELADLAEKAELPGLRAALNDPTVAELLSGALGNSPHLTRLLMRDPAFTADILTLPPAQTRSRIITEMALDCTPAPTREQIMIALRRGKERMALLSALCDISGVWQLADVTSALSELAEAALALTCGHLLQQAAAKGDIELPDDVMKFADLAGEDITLDRLHSLSKGSGYIVLGMGKLGAGELNYSSDIDLIILYDNEIVRHAGTSSLQDFYPRLTRDLVQIMQKRTGQGYVFRTDLRLRPDPSATAVALSTDAAEAYYASTGLNWERAAMIKARPVAGDLIAGQGFLERTAQFVWRKHLDFAAMEDIHRIKGQIHSHHQHARLAAVLESPAIDNPPLDEDFVAYDVKLGPGGIREVEFFAQIQQLIAGGRDPRLRVPQTREMLKILVKVDRIAPEDQIAFDDAYCFLRQVEHRLQMVQDAQTHSLPDTEEGIRQTALFMGFDGSTAFLTELRQHLDAVSSRYQTLLEDGGDDSADNTGDQETELQLDFLTTVSAPDVAASTDEDSNADIKVEPDPETRQQITDLGFKDVDRVAAILGGWQRGRLRATRTDRARALLVKLSPALLLALADTADPDSALLRFNEFVTGLPSGVQFFSLLQANPWLLELLGEIMGIAPALAETLRRNTSLLDAVLNSDYFEVQTDLVAELDRILTGAQDFQDVLDIIRRWANEQKFCVGVRTLRGTQRSADSRKALSDIATTALQSLFPLVEQEFTAQHGRLPGGALGVLALGKLGSGEMTFSSDLDLVFIYDTQSEDASSDGAKPLPGTQYFARLGKRFINAITALTGEGRLYEVDMRLRPSGAAGPIAISLDAFAKYHRESAWTWEHMALTRGRVIIGPPGLSQRIEDVVRSTLLTPRDRQTTLADIADMRRRIDDEYGTSDPWSLKYVRGGQVDLEFIAQGLQLVYGADNPSLLHRSTVGTFVALGNAGLVKPEVSEDLIAAQSLIADLQNMLRLCSEEGFKADDAPEGLREMLCEMIGVKDFPALEKLLLSSEAKTRTLFDQLIANGQ